MDAPNPIPLLAHLKPVRYKAGLRYWHAHRYVLNPATGLYEYPPGAFYAGCRYRFSGLLGDPPRAMWYAGSSAACSLLETDLRDVFGDEDGNATVLANKIAGRRVTAMRSLRAFHFIDLTPAGLRAIAGSPATRDAWHALTVTPTHAETHAPTAAVLATAAAAGIAIDGFIWHSRQCASRHDAPLACALFKPPMADPDFAIDDSVAPIALDTPAGDTLLRQALANCGLNLRWQWGEKDENRLAE